MAGQFPGNATEGLEISGNFQFWKFAELGIAGVWDRGVGNCRKFPEIPSSGNFYQISRATILLFQLSHGHHDPCRGKFEYDIISIARP